MAIRKLKRTDKESGKVNKSTAWYVFFADQHGTERAFSAGCDKEAAQSMELWVKKLVASRKSMFYPPEIQDWIDTLPNRLKAKFVKWDLLSGCRVAVTRPLKEHLTDWRNTLKSSGITEKQAEQLYCRVTRMFDECGFVLWPDISASKLTQAVEALQKTVRRKKGVAATGAASAHTKRHFLRACKQFCKWAVQDGRAGNSPLEHLSRGAEVKNKRRALTPDEIEYLLQYAQKAGAVFNVSGTERSLIYRVAIETGLRRNEIASLKRPSFDFEKRTMTVAAEDTKNRKTAVLPLKATTAAMIKEHLKGKMPAAAAFKMTCNAAKMLQKDLTDARAAWIKEAAEDADEHRRRNESGFLKIKTEAGKLDFHSLRHTFGTLLAASGVHPKTAQELMRHGSIDLTMSIYTHAQADQVTAAIDALPEFNRQVCAKTGTDDKAVGIDVEKSGKTTPVFSLIQPTFGGKTGQSMAIAVDFAKNENQGPEGVKSLNFSEKIKVLTQNRGSGIVLHSLAPVAQLDRASVYGTEG